MSESILTIDFLHKSICLAKQQQPCNKPVVGLIINGKAWRKLKEQIGNAYPTIRDFSHFSLNDKFCGATVYETDISPTYAEVYFDQEILNSRLKELKIL